MDQDVIIAGIGLTSVDEHWDQSLRDLAYQVIDQARLEAGGVQPQAMYVANMLAAPLLGQSQLGALLADYAGMRGIEAHTVEAAGASGGIALRQAYLAIRSGEVEAALVVGVEKVSDRRNSEVAAAMMTASDTDYEAVHGLDLTAQAAMMTQRYLHDYDAPADALANFSLIAHDNAVGNPLAMFRRSISAELYSKAAMASAPLSMFDAAPIADGAAAVLLMRRDLMPEPAKHPLVRIAGSASAVAAPALHDRKNLLNFTAVTESVESALKRAGVERSQISFFELHDLFTINAALSLEASGFAQAGEGWRLAAEGEVKRAGRLPILTFGGSKARGDTAGATGLYQIAEATLQLQNRAEECQIEGTSLAMTQCLGGFGATAATHILQKMD